LPQTTQDELQRLQDVVLLARKHIRAVEAVQIDALKQVREGKASEHAAMVEQVWQLMGWLGVGVHTAWPVVFEAFGWRAFKNRRQVGNFMGLTATPFDSGNSTREQGISKCGPPKLRAMMVELAWRWIRHQPDSDPDALVPGEVCCRQGIAQARHRGVGAAAIDPVVAVPGARRDPLRACD
jgi:transposase